MKKVQIQVINNAHNKTLPQYETTNSAGVDVRAIITEPFVIPAGGKHLFQTGLKVSIPEGYEIQVRPRSGLAHKHFQTVLNSPGTIDSDYRGDVGVILVNHGGDDYTVEPGERIAQLVLAPVFQIEWEEVEELDETVRGEGGFGHTGKV